jgi:ureidoacrylate peracid hydrolase
VIRKNADPLSALDHEAEPPLDIARGRTALLIVDMQYDSAHRDYGIGARAREKGKLADVAYRFAETEKTIPNIQRVQRACRAAGIEVIFARLAGLTQDGRDHPRQRRPHYASKEAQILDEIAPVGDEIVLNKTTSSPFPSTHLDYLLRSMGIDNLLVCGVATSGCVELTVRDADDRGYHVAVIGDCCAGNSPETHRQALERMNRRRMRVRDTAEVVALIDAAAVGSVS